MGIDEDAAQALDSVALNKAHSPHIRCEIVNLYSSLAHATAVVFLTQVEAKRFGARQAKVPVTEWLFVDCTNTSEALLSKVASCPAGLPTLLVTWRR